MTADWIREEWLAARRAAEHATHPPGCTCRDCARAEIEAGEGE